MAINRLQLHAWTRHDRQRLPIFVPYRLRRAKTGGDMTLVVGTHVRLGKPFHLTDFSHTL